MKTLQIESHKTDNNKLLYAAGIKRIHPGWYSVSYNGAKLDISTICGAKRNKGGEIICK